MNEPLLVAGSEIGRLFKAKLVFHVPRYLIFS
jgi:hypothetical protein